MRASQATEITGSHWDSMAIGVHAFHSPDRIGRLPPNPTTTRFATPLRVGPLEMGGLG